MSFDYNKDRLGRDFQWRMTIMRRIQVSYYFKAFKMT